jgi:hypothetical protein
LRELREQTTVLAQRAQIEREEFVNALQSMDYERALACQIKLERLESELSEASSRLYLRPDR